MEAQQWGVRPSQLVGVSDTYVAYCLDQAVGYYGSWVDAELDKASSKPSKEEVAAVEKRKRRIREILGTAEDDKTQGQFRDPAEFFK